jgi:nitroreductase
MFIGIDSKAEGFCLAVQALGFAGRPIGGFFDLSLNELVQVSPDNETALLVILAGYAVL